MSQSQSELKCGRCDHPVSIPEPAPAEWNAPAFQFVNCLRCGSWLDYCGFSQGDSVLAETPVSLLQRRKAK